MSAILIAALGGNVAWGHDGDRPGPVVIDTDMGLDDVVTLAAALQHPTLDIRALVITPGAMSAEDGAAFAERLLALFNRHDVAVYVSERDAPARTGARRFVAPALPDAVPQRRQTLTPDAYVPAHAAPTLIVLGPMTNLAAMLDERPALARRFRGVIAPGLPNPRQNWNLQADTAAYEAVRATETPLTFVAPGANGAKPGDWNIGRNDFGPGTSIGEQFLRRLFAQSETREHYLEALDQLTDELAVLYVAERALFEPDADGVFTPISHSVLMAHVVEAFVEGRQRRLRALLTEDPLPDGAFQPTLRAARGRIIANNGQTEWLAQLLLGEVHQHVGAYSIIGAKMGLRAAELLNAPQHGMTIVSHTPPKPPVSCLNDGLIVATGCTPGRALFSMAAGEDERTVAASFSYNGRTITLRLKPEYRERIAKHIRKLLTEYTLEDAAYWQGVETLAMDVWENWHRRDLFDVTDEP